MDTPTTSLVIGGAALAVLLVVAVGSALLVGGSRRARSLTVRLEELRADNADLRARLDLLEAAVRPGHSHDHVRPVDSDDYVVPEVLPGDAGDDLPVDRPVPDQLVLSATLGEPLVKAAALGHGLRRALSAQARNRIWFEVRREVRRSRKQRRADMKAAYRHFQRQPAPDLGEL